MIKPRLKRFLSIFIVIALVVFIWANRTGKLEPAPYSEKGTIIPVKSGEPLPPHVIPVSFGSYVEKIYDFEVQAQTFSAEGWVWITWPQAFQDLITANKIPVANILAAMNGIQNSDFAFKPGTDNPVRLPDGRYYQIFTFTGKFYADNLDFRRFPFETIRFPLTFSLNPQLISLNAGAARLIPDKVESGLGEYTNLPGYVLAGKQFIELIYQFQSGFGLPQDHPGATETFSRIKMEVVYNTSMIAAFLQLVLPLAVVMSVVLLAPNLAGTLWDVRIALPSTALLTLIFLQQGYRTQLPSLPYLTFIDQIYALCYAAALAIFYQFVWSSNQLDQATDENRKEIVDFINHRDFRLQIRLLVGLLVLATLGWFFPVK